ncbi:MAG: YhcH/YjgK/YiaL family protein [Clostridia bacterium]|nr:YhcH/YjgK/YiaL family protein [Clostridia bacterium]
MIFDTIDNIASYADVLPGLREAAAFAQDFARAPKPDGRYEIDGERIFANVSTYTTKSRDGAEFEAHRRYADLQVMIRGTECIGWAALGDTLRETREEYSKGGDIAFYTGETGMDIRLSAGTCVLLLPQDAHMPCLHADGAPQTVTKIVIKIALA